MGEAKNKARRGKRLCIFCQDANGTLSRQHILPDRIGNVLPRIETSHFRAPLQIAVAPASVAFKPSLPKKVNGHLGARKLLLVCKSCNEGWIEAAEHAAFEYIDPLMLGQSIKLNQQAQADVSLTLAIMAVMMDREKFSTRSIPDADASHLFCKREVPPHWQLFVGRQNDPSWNYRWRHQGGLGMRPDHSTAGCFVITIGLGALVAQIIGSNDRGEVVDAWHFSLSLGLRPLHPYRRDIDFSLLSTLDERAMRNVVEKLGIDQVAIAARYLKLQSS